jgi:hypothetical protein
MSSPLIQIVVVAIVAYIVWRLMQPKYPIRIVMENRRVEHHEGLPKAQEGSVLAFLRNDLECDARLVISAARRPNGGLLLDIKGPIEPGKRQQIRNFLNTML